MFRKPALLIACLAAAVAPVAASAHHSFAAFFNADKLIKIRGTIASFRFGNPHGTIVVDVKDKAGQVHKWRIETNAPVGLQQKGWTRDTLKPGQKVIAEGWLARNGQRYMRLRQVYNLDGSPVVREAFTTKED